MFLSEVGFFFARRETTCNNQLRILIGLERNCQQTRWLVENEIPPCYVYMSCQYLCYQYMLYVDKFESIIYFCNRLHSENIVNIVSIIVNISTNKQSILHGIGCSARLIYSMNTIWYTVIDEPTKHVSRTHMKEWKKKTLGKQLMNTLGKQWPWKYCK
jgi:hypothetical protein